MIPLKRDQVIQLGVSTLVITALAFAISSQIRPDILEGGVYKRLEVLFSAWNSLPLTQHYFVPFIRGEANGYADGTVHTHIRNRTGCYFGGGQEPSLLSFHYQLQKRCAFLFCSISFYGRWRFPRFKRWLSRTHEVL